MFMFPFNPNADNIVYGHPFIATFPILYKWHILEFLSPSDYVMNSTIMFLISIFFSIAAALFCLSVLEDKRKKFMLPFALSLIAAFSNLIQFIVQRPPENISPNIFSNETMSFYSFFIFSLLFSTLVYPS